MKAVVVAVVDAIHRLRPTRLHQIETLTFALGRKKTSLNAARVRKAHKMDTWLSF